MSDTNQKENQQQPAWKRYFRGWNLFINGIIAFIPAIMVTVILLEIGFPNALASALPIISFVYLVGIIREKISKKARQKGNAEMFIENKTKPKQGMVQNTEVEAKTIENKGSKKKWVWAGVGVVILLIVIGTLSSSGVPDENIDLITTDKSSDFSEQSGNLYRNTKYNFRIKFPQGWDIKPGDGPNILQKAVSGNHTILVGVREIPAEFGDETATIKDVMSLAEFKDTLLEGVQEKFPGAKLLDYGESKLDNESAYWIKYTAPYTALDITVQSTHIQYQLLKNNIFYFISAGSTADEFSSAKPEFMKSIATFVTENY